jgi:hypothetical protein
MAVPLIVVIAVTRPNAKHEEFTGARNSAREHDVVEPNERTPGIGVN